MTARPDSFPGRGDNNLGLRSSPKGCRSLRGLVRACGGSINVLFRLHRLGILEGGRSRGKVLINGRCEGARILIEH